MPFITEKNELSARKSCVCLPNLISKYSLSQGGKKKKDSLKRKLYHHGGFFMAFAKDYGFIHLRNSLFIHRKGWMFLQCSTCLQTIPRPFTNHMQAFGLETQQWLPLVERMALTSLPGVCPVFGRHICYQMFIPLWQPLGWFGMSEVEIKAR